MHFEWDESKNQANLKKHGIDFETAKEAIRRFDRSVGAEDRFHIIGKIRGVLVILVAYTNRKNAVRIISARPAGRDKGVYNDN